MEGTEVRKLAELEDRHWWYAERRTLLAAQVRRLGRVGTALDVGSGPGVATPACCGTLDGVQWRWSTASRGPRWRTGAVCRPCAVTRPDCRYGRAVSISSSPSTSWSTSRTMSLSSPRSGASCDRAAPSWLPSPAGMANWSAHDEAVGHVRRYEREPLRSLLTRGGFAVDELKSWNVLMAPLARWRRRASTGSDLEHVSPVINAGARAVVALERVLPVGRIPGISLLATARLER